MASNQTEARSATQTTYVIDPGHTLAEFAVKHMMLSTVKGRFGKVSGEILVDDHDLTKSTVAASAEVASVETGDAQRDTHLRSADFFDAEHFPTIAFHSTRIERKGGADEYLIHGELAIRGVRRAVTFDATYLGKGKDPWGNSRIGISATTTINRKDFGLQWNVALEAGGFLVGDTIKLALEVQAIAQA